MTTPTTKDLVDFILENRRGKVFKNWSDAAIYSYICECLETNTLAYATHEGKVVGVVCGTKTLQKNIYIMEILTTRAGVLKQFVAFFKRIYPDYTLTAHRRGKYIEYNTPKLVAKLSI